MRFALSGINLLPLIGAEFCITAIFSAVRGFLQTTIIESQKSVNGQVRLRLYKGNSIVLGRSSVVYPYLLEYSLIPRYYGAILT